jgi:hypothetical protein
MFGSTSVRLAFCRLLLFAVVGSLYAAGPTFEVASVKASLPLTMKRYGDLQWRPLVKIDPAHATFRNQSFLKLIAFAWHVKEYEVKGPEWMELVPLVAGARRQSPASR